MRAPQAMARLWRVAHFVLTDFLELSLEEMPACLTAYPPGIPATAPSALTASMHLGVLPEPVSIPVWSPMYRAAGLLPHDTYPCNKSSRLWVTKLIIGVAAVSLYVR